MAWVVFNMTNFFNYPCNSFKCPELRSVAITFRAFQQSDLHPLHLRLNHLWFTPSSSCTFKTIFPTTFPCMIPKTGCFATYSKNTSNFRLRLSAGKHPCCLHPSRFKSREISMCSNHTTNITYSKNFVKLFYETQ